MVVTARIQKQLEKSVQALSSQEHDLVSRAQSASTTSLDDAYKAMHQLQTLLDIEGVSIQKVRGCIYSLHWCCRAH
eukprot:COSAG01_NODE_592_length_15109_cov_39.247435_5_plen_76_part_00